MSKAKAKSASPGDALKEASEHIKDFGTCPACGGKTIKGLRVFQLEGVGRRLSFRDMGDNQREKTHPCQY